MYRGILGSKNNTSILHKNSLFADKTCCGLTALFVKTQIYFCRCNFVNKKVRAQNISENVCSFGNGTPNLWAPTENVPVQNEKLSNSF